MNFGDQAKGFERLLKRVDWTVDRRMLGRNREVLILVLPWMETAVPWYAITLGLLYRHRGFRPVILFDDLPPPNPSEPVGQIAVIAQVLGQLEGKIEVCQLSAGEEVAEEPSDQLRLDQQSELNVGSYLHRTGARDPKAAECFRAGLRNRIGRLRVLLRARKWDHLVLPGGIYGTSGLARVVAEETQLRTATYDSGPGTMVLGTDATAAHCQDLAKISEPRYADFVEAHREQAIHLGREEYELRTRGRDRYAYQATAYEQSADAEPLDVLVPMNVFDDAAALGRNRFFANPSEWLMETVGFILRETPANLVCREHPAARHLDRDDLFGAMVQEQFNGHPRFRFVGCQEKVSTYSLLERARLILPHTSTVGIEAAGLGKRVVVETDVYYANAGFVAQAHSREHYFALLREALAADQALPLEQRERAWLYYFYGQVANFVDSEFTPQPVDFARWVRWSWTDLVENAQVKLMVDVLSEGTPAWRLQSEGVFARGGLPAAKTAQSNWWRRWFKR